MKATAKEKKIHARLVRAARGVSAELSAALAKTGPLALPRRDDRQLAEYLCRVIIGQQLSAGAARTIWGRVEDLARERRLGIVKLVRGGFENQLRDCGVSRQKILALADLARAHGERRLGVARLERMTHEQRSERLREVRGIGQWTCDMTSIFYFGDADVWPSGDLSVMQELRRFVGDDGLENTLEIFRPHRSYLALAMYRLRDG